MATNTIAPQATVATMSVNVQVMKIGNRQVTLSIFKQIKSDNKTLFDLKGGLKIEPWGYVNYHVGCELHQTHEHLHVVWSTPEGELRRGVMLRHPFDAEGENWPEGFYDLQEYVDSIVESLIEALYAESFDNEKLQLALKNGTHARHYRVAGEHPDYADRHQIRLQYGGKFFIITGYFPKIYQMVIQGFSHSDYWREKVHLPVWDGVPMPSSKLLDELDKAQKQVDDFQLNWQRSYQTVIERGQLFIAV